MKTLYWDCTAHTGCGAVGLVLEPEDGKHGPAALVQAGTTCYLMPVTDKCAAYDQYAREWDICFLFEDDPPVLPFYAVPRLDVFARDSCGGLFATVGEGTDRNSPAPICYIDPARQCFLAAENLEQLIAAPRWRPRLTPMEGVTLYPGREAAMAELAFFDLPEPPSVDR